VSRLAAVLVVAAALAAGGCGGSGTPAPTPTGSDFASVEKAARGQTVRFWMYGGDDRVNAYVDDEVAPAAAKRGVMLRRVPVGDTADAVKRVIAERRAGRTTGGGVDLIWINGENFASGKQAGLWLADWAESLPNAKRYVDFSDPTIRNDFHIETDGQESPWQRSIFIYAYDAAKVPRPPRTFDALLAYAKAHPGRFTYPAPPEFTGSAFVRQVIADKGEAAGFAYLKELKPLMYRGGRTFPKSQAELDALFADGQVDFAMAYDANFVNTGVRKGGFPKTARPFLIGRGALANTSYVTIPANAAHIAGAKVVADVMLDPALQASLADPSKLGYPTVLDLRRLGARRSLFERRAANREYVLPGYGETVSEFAAARVGLLEKRWASEVLR
jgi:putative spermidine/putrescine transport system substrate-binding protein